MKIDKITIGLSIVLAAVVALTVFSASFPASGTDAVQNATVSANTTAINICAQGGNTSYLVTYWNFTVQTGAICDTPVNNWNETQNPTANQSGICTLNNTHTADMTVYIQNGSWTGSSVVTDYKYNSSNSTTNGEYPTALDIVFDGTEQNLGSMTTNTNISLWLKLTGGKRGTATSTFTVTSEV